MYFKTAGSEDFDVVCEYVKDLWSYNTYDKEETRTVYHRVISDPNTFAFLLVGDDGSFKGFCHGVYFDTFWLSGKTCYLSSIISNQQERGCGYGRILMDHAKELAVARGCKGIVLDSGLPRTGAHGFYEHYGFEKSCYGFDLLL